MLAVYPRSGSVTSAAVALRTEVAACAALGVGADCCVKQPAAAGARTAG